MLATDRQQVDVAAIRARHPIPAVAGSTVKLRRAGHEWKACCPFHEDRSPSFTIFEGGERFHCFGCGATGDVLDFVQLMHRVSLPEAAAILDGKPQASLPVQRQRRSEPTKDTMLEAAAVWRSAGPIGGTPGEVYLRNRGLSLQLPSTLRFARLKYGRGDVLPCLVALVTGPDNRVSGVQRTFVREDGTGKANVPSPRLSLGRLTGGAIRLAPAAADLVVTGGVEDGLTLQQEVGRPTWAAAGEGNMANMVLPEVVTSVTIGADRDESGDRHAQRAGVAFSEQGRKVRIMRPCLGFKDFNDELRGVCA
jgi:DNA primase